MAHCFEIIWMEIIAKRTNCSWFHLNNTFDCGIYFANFSVLFCLHLPEIFVKIGANLFKCKSWDLDWFPIIKLMTNLKFMSWHHHSCSTYFYEWVLDQIDKILLAVQRHWATISQNYFKDSFIETLKLLMQLPFIHLPWYFF